MLLSFKVLCRQNSPGYFLVTNEATSAAEEGKKKTGTPLFTGAKVQPLWKDVFVGTQ